MKLLVIGGTRFLGRHLAAAARARGAEVTLFHRGTDPALDPAYEHVLGDRDGGLAALAGRRWDAVVDSCGYVPRVVRASATALAGAANHYAFVSSISVYASVDDGQTREDSATETLADPTVETVSGETYGGLKAACEREVLAALPGRALVIRPGLIVGPHDSTDRFPYWPRRVARGGRMLAPGDPRRQVQLIDARDLAEWMFACAERKTTGTFNAIGPERPLAFDGFLDACRTTLASEAEPVWVDDAFLLEHGVQPFTEMPLWLPPEAAGMQRVDPSRALAAGLEFRPLAETIRDTLAWDRARGPAAASHALVGPSMTAERERDLLAAWDARAAHA